MSARVNEQRQTWQQRRTNLPKHNATNIYFQYPDASKSRGLLNLNRANLTLINKAISGQNFIAYHQSKIDITISKFSRLCEEEEETFIHLLTSCPRLEISRKEIFFDRVP